MISTSNIFFLMNDNDLDRWFYFESTTVIIKTGKKLLSLQLFSLISCLIKYNIINYSERKNVPKK